MASLCSSTMSLNQLPLSSTSVIKLASCNFFSSSINFLKVTKYPRSKSFSFSFNGSFLIGNTCKLGSGRLGFFPSNSARYWEDPDGGSGSEFEDDDSDEDEEEEEEENDFEFESDWEPENSTAATVTTKTANNSSSTSYQEDLVAEVEQMLSLDEKAILQQNGAPDLEKVSTAKWNPLHTFALAAQIPYMDKLLVDGFDIDMIDKDGLTALHHAIIGKKEAVISHLLRKGANPQVRDLDGVTPLHYAVQVGAMQTVKLLIKYKVDVNVADNEGWTPLHVAVQSRNRDIVKILLVNGADKNRRNQHGKTPLDLSLCYGKDFKSYDLAKLLKVVPANRDL